MPTPIPLPPLLLPSYTYSSCTHRADRMGATTIFIFGDVSFLPQALVKSRTKLTLLFLFVVREPSCIHLSSQQVCAQTYCLWMVIKLYLVCQLILNYFLEKKMKGNYDLMSTYNPCELVNCYHMLQSNPTIHNNKNTLFRSQRQLSLKRLMS